MREPVHERIAKEEQPSGSPIPQAERLHPGWSEPATIRLVRQGEVYRDLWADGALGEERYRSQDLNAEEPCACDGNPMPVGHPVYRDDRGYAIAAEHCEVVAEVERVEVDEMGHAFVWVVAPAAINGREIAGIWYLRNDHLVDNHVRGSAPWTRSLAESALRGIAPGAEVGEREATMPLPTIIPPVDWDASRCWECQVDPIRFACAECGDVLCWLCTQDHECAEADAEAFESEWRPARRVELAIGLVGGSCLLFVLWGALQAGLRALSVTQAVVVIVIVVVGAILDRSARPIAGLICRIRLGRRLLGGAAR